MTRTRVCESRPEAERVADQFQAEGYRVVVDTPAETRLRRRDHGSVWWHLFVFLLTFWTLGLGNLVFALYRRVTSKETVRVVVE